MTYIHYVDEKKIFPVRELWHSLCFPERTEYNGTDSLTGILYCPLSIPVKTVCWHKPLALLLNGKADTDVNDVLLLCSQAVDTH